jgi:hypothetical protein
MNNEEDGIWPLILLIPELVIDRVSLEYDPKKKGKEWPKRICKTTKDQGVIDPLLTPLKWSFT